MFRIEAQTSAYVVMSSVNEKKNVTQRATKKKNIEGYINKYKNISRSNFMKNVNHNYNNNNL